MKPINELLELKNKAAIVTGGAKGIGYGISYRLAESGAKVIIADIDEEAAKVASKELNSKGFTTEAIKIDVSVEKDVKKMINYCQENYGSVDILVNNAGIYPAQPISIMSVEDFEKVLNINLKSVFMTTKYASEIMKKNNGGSIINITSIDALHPSMIGLAHYDASKHGVWGFTKNSALELAEHNIRVNAIAPGGIKTPGASGSSDSERMKVATEAFLEKIPMHRMGDIDDIGKVCLFLASNMSSYMTGSQIVVDGGFLLK